MRVLVSSGSLFIITPALISRASKDGDGCCTSYVCDRPMNAASQTSRGDDRPSHHHPAHAQKTGFRVGCLGFRTFLLRRSGSGDHHGGKIKCLVLVSTRFWRSARSQSRITRV
ncbi:hypothetical protein F5Y15DRAFT_388472 [Xylariaceae sp. FL0016]|nr:hypothetical protein F5Y15DRAFT_388472 [Xylariaceae sp. FL0016]